MAGWQSRYRPARSMTLVDPKKGRDPSWGPDPSSERGEALTLCSAKSLIRCYAAIETPLRFW